MSEEKVPVGCKRRCCLIVGLYLDQTQSTTLAYNMWGGHSCRASISYVVILCYDSMSDWPHPQATPRFYLAAVEKNQEKAWDQYYITSRTGNGELG